MPALTSAQHRVLNRLLHEPAVVPRSFRDVHRELRNARAPTPPTHETWSPAPI
ncbi:MAG TPA: hypothetical protein VEI97_11900 [bacterium]|nr:hypothetical protein [bacterium]